MNAVEDRLDAVHDHVFDANRIGVEPDGIAGQVCAAVDRSRIDLVRIEDHDVGDQSFFEPAPIAQAQQPGGHVAQLAHCLLETDQPEAAYAVAEHLGRLGKGVDHVEMGTRVRGADEGPIVVPELASNGPGFVIAANRDR